MLEPAQWDSVLGSITGTIVRGSERISSNRLLDALDVGDDPVLRAKVAKRLRAPMRALGWHGPSPMRISSETGHAAGCSGYWRSSGGLRPLAVPVEGAVEAEVGGLADDLPEALEAVTRLGLRKLAKVLREPLDPTDASRTRNQVTAAGIAINAQLRADEQRLRAKVGTDVLERLLKEIERSRRELQAAESLPRAGQDEDMSEREKSSGEAS
jgi:hypothetical protein